MKNYNIGDIIEVKALVEFYSGKDERYIERKEFKEDLILAYYVGYTSKQTGKIKEIREDSGFDEGPVYIVNVLENIKTHKVARIRFHDRGKEHYALFDDIEIDQSTPVEILKSTQIKSINYRMFKENNNE